MKKEKIRFVLIFLFLILIGFVMYSYFNQGIIYYLIQGDLGLILNYLAGYNNLAIFIFIFLIILEVIFAPIPPILLYLVGGLFFGSFFGGTLALIGNVVGAALAFQIAKHFGRDFIKKKITTKTRKRFDDLSDKHGPLTIFILRINPLTSTDLFSYFAGLTKMKFWKFLLGTVLGLAPIIYLQSYLGGSLSSNPFLFKLFLIFSIIYLGAFVGIFFWVRFKKNK